MGSGISRLLRSWGTSGLAVTLALATTGVVAGHGGDDGLHHHDGWMGTHDGFMGAWGGWLWGGLGLLLLLGLLVAVVVLVARGSGAASGASADRRGVEDALAVLRRRYAEGDIDEEEFERRRTRLLETTPE